jgi:hypothetical protein
MTLTAEEFIRRFLLHVLPNGFRRIRYYGFLGNRHREEKLAVCRRWRAARHQGVGNGLFCYFLLCVIANRLIRLYSP